VLCSRGGFACGAPADAMAENGALEPVYVMTASGNSTQLQGNLAIATILDVKRAYENAKGVPAWQQRLIVGTHVLDNDMVLVECGISAGSVLQLVIIQNLSELPGLGGDWVAYMFNGSDRQWRDALRLGSNVDGIGDPGSVFCNPSQMGCYKMSEAVFDDQRFTEVAAVGSDKSWALIKRSDGGVIPAADAFKVGGSEGYQFIFSDGTITDSSTNRWNADLDNMHWAHFGPFFDDASYNNVLNGSGWQWMWSSERGDKGTILGSAGFSSHRKQALSGYAWTWYARVGAT